MSFAQLGKWSRLHDSCVRCGSVRRKHRGRGLCCSCYWAVRYETNDAYRHGALARAARRYAKAKRLRINAAARAAKAAKRAVRNQEAGE